MSLAQRVRDFRYTKGWGPDELANRAEISRTALYQIESGKTELPRAGTLRRIALALDVSMDTLLGHVEAAAAPGRSNRGAFTPPPSNWARGTTDWYPAEGAPMATPSPRHMPRYELTEGPRFAQEYTPTSVKGLENGSAVRERELSIKLQELLSTPFGEAIARIIEETYRLLPPSVPVATAGASVRGL
jgi:transcriptional regulator with XRE-family HTH domain